MFVSVPPLLRVHSCLPPVCSTAPPCHRRVEMGLPATPGSGPSQDGDNSYLLPVSLRLKSPPCSNTKPYVLQSAKANPKEQERCVLVAFIRCENHTERGGRF